jgi:glutamate racemase
LQRKPLSPFNFWLGISGRLGDEVGGDLSVPAMREVRRRGPLFAMDPGNQHVQNHNMQSNSVTSSLRPASSVTVHLPKPERQDALDKPSYEATSALAFSLANRSPKPSTPFVGSNRPSLRKALGDDVRYFSDGPQGATFKREFWELYSQHIVGGNARGVRDLMINAGIGDPLSALYRFGTAKSVALLTGFKVPVQDPNARRGYIGIQETDGPLGVAFMALGCLQTNKTVSVVCDKETQPLVEACLKELGGENAAAAVRFLIYEAQGDEAQRAANGIADALVESRTDLLVPIEVAGRNSKGVARSMSGIDITHLNPDYDTLVRTLAHQMNVIAIGDGGNEAGLGGSVRGVPKALDGKDMQATTGADYAVPATVSNWGGYLMYVGLMRLANKARDDMPSVGDHNGAIRAMLTAGAVDGYTKNADETFFDGKQRTGVDGLSVEENAVVYHAATLASSTVPLEFPLGRFPEWDKPVTVMMLDSSDGVFYAAKVAIPYLDAQLPGEKTYVLFGDHGNAPYGPKTPEQIESYVSNALSILRKFSDAPVVMACNTACIALDRLERKGIPVSDINLVKNTSNVVVTDPHKHVALLATAAMADSKLYQHFISQGLADNSLVNKDVRVYGCSGWAEIVNARALDSADPEVRSEADQVIRAGLEPLSPDLDAIYLCCTHFPALTSRIVKIYEEKRRAAGVAKPFLVLNPMKRQAETAARVYSKGNFRESPVPTRFPILVLTTGDADQARRTANVLLNRDDIDALSVAYSRPAKGFDRRSPMRTVSAL